ncbi:MAG TPA: amidohydrolase family protein [Acidimicrobiales bacterium]|nr:amidohydrolase family protein [Acidimicrobiales bacterium]
MTTHVASLVVTPNGVLTPGEVTTEDGTIVDVRPHVGAAPERILCPGFVDLQVNGHDDVDVATACDEDWERLDVLLADQGVTAWCPTITTAPIEVYEERLQRIATAAQRRSAHGRPTIIGAHLEGPFLGDAHGAHNPAWVAALDLEWLRALPPIVRIVTLGPEQPLAVEAIVALTARQVLVSMGHSKASFEQAISGADAGARLVTHLFNGMAPLHHRAPGLLGAALSDDRLVPSLIADGVHVHPAALRAAARAKGRGGWVLVTDAVGWQTHDRVEIVDGAPRLPDGTIAGSCARMDECVARMVQEAGIDIVDVVHAAATTPARLVGIEGERGALAAGLRADLVFLDPHTLRVTEVLTAE